MDLISAAGFLIQRAVQTATQLQHQHSREKETRTSPVVARDKHDAALGEPIVTPVRSSAYRVTISPAALQRLTVSSVAS
ncbi:MAG: hypothetical protein HQM03_13030 [Magnetococcales bacterium]|nr:hypothetical protein [Magnetococcales bacterium]